ncbi:5545_t:CDS:10 [Ambispora gerdemannii]|uniref:5545_t:CDS:1 n=1 Tax=Ambispora gerdemannii TaxID=144530 RepID=A0A9N8V716_9GLOM|nr:5545_t:CDS:10 [Ambispora gerdemannii]
MTSQLPTLLNTNYLTSGHSRGFFEFVSRVAEAKSNQEEERYVTEELYALRQKLAQPDINLDLNSRNHHEICAALGVMSHVVDPEMIPAILKPLQEKLTHNMEIVRKKTLLVFHHFYQSSPDLILHLEPQFCDILKSRDPAVLGAVLCLYVDFVKDNPSQFRDLVPIFINILEQVLDRWLARTYDYHGIPAPWIQIQLVEILGLLGRDDEIISEEVCPIIIQTLRKSEQGVDAAYAVIFECVRALSRLSTSTFSKIANQSSSITNDNPLNIITHFLKSKNLNLKYIGLLAVSEIDPKWWVEGDWWGEEQMNVIVECLDEKDETLKRKVIVDRIMEALKTTSFYDKDSSWIINTLIATFRAAGDLVDESLVDRVVMVITKKEEGYETVAWEQNLRKCAVYEFFKLIESKEVVNGLPNSLLILAIKILSELITYTDNQDTVISRLSDCLLEVHVAEIQIQIMNSLLKCISLTKKCPKDVKAAVIKCRTNTSFEIKQCCNEFIILTDNLALLEKIVINSTVTDNWKSPFNDSFIIDDSLLFLDDYVKEAIENGGKSYSPVPIIRNSSESSAKDKKARLTIRYEAYDKPTLPDFRRAGKPVTRVEDESWRVGSLGVTPGQSAWIDAESQSTLPSKNTVFLSEYEENITERQFPSIPTNKSMLIPDTKLSSSLDTSSNSSAQDTKISQTMTLVDSSDLMLLNTANVPQKWSRAGYQTNEPIQPKKFHDSLEKESTITTPNFKEESKLTSTPTVPIKSEDAMNPILRSSTKRLASALFIGIGGKAKTASNVSMASNSSNSGANDHSKEPTASLSIPQNLNQTLAVAASQFSIPRSPLIGIRRDYDFPNQFQQKQEQVIQQKSILDNLTPIQMTIPEFRESWGKLTHEKQQEVSGALVVDNTNLLKRRLEDGIGVYRGQKNRVGSDGIAAGFHVIGVIANEGIAAAYLALESEETKQSSSVLESEETKQSSSVLESEKTKQSLSVSTVIKEDSSLDTPDENTLSSNTTETTSVVANSPPPSRSRKSTLSYLVLLHFRVKSRFCTYIVRSNADNNVAQEISRALKCYFVLE